MRKIGLSILAMPLLPLICVLYILLPSAEVRQLLVSHERTFEFVYY